MPSTSRRSWTSPRANRSASRTWTTSGAWRAAETWAAGASCPTRRVPPPAAPTRRPGPTPSRSWSHSTRPASTRPSSTASHTPTRRAPSGRASRRSRRTRAQPDTARHGVRASRCGSTRRRSPTSSAACRACCRPASTRSTSGSCGRRATPVPDSAPPGSPARAYRSAGRTRSSARACSICRRPSYATGASRRTGRRSRPSWSTATSWRAGSTRWSWASPRSCSRTRRPACPSSSSATGPTPASPGSPAPAATRGCANSLWNWAC